MRRFLTQEFLDDTKPYRATANLLWLAYTDFPAIREVLPAYELPYLTLRDSDDFALAFPVAEGSEGTFSVSER